MRVGVTGHQRLAAHSSWDWVRDALSAVLAETPRPLVGLSCLAAGADQLFARLVLDAGGEHEAVIPFAGYAAAFPDEEGRAEYERLLGLSARVETLPRLGSDEECYLAAGLRVVERSEMLVAVWDGQPAAGLGGTADVVAHAREIGRRLVHVDPIERRVTRR